MTTQSTPAAARPAVRLPFRVLAALVAILAGVAVIGTAVRIGLGERSVTIGDILILPLMMGSTRLTYQAAVHAKSPAHDMSWPFASGRVAKAYLLLLLAYHLTHQ